MMIFLGCDHAGIEEKNSLKQMLLDNGLNVTDCGIQDGEKIDYPVISQTVSDNVKENDNALGFIICGTGIGVSIKANRNKGIRAALVYDEFSAVMAKEHNNANVVCFGARTLGTSKILKYAGLYLQSEYLGATEEGKRHDNRVKMLDQ